MPPVLRKRKREESAPANPGKKSKRTPTPNLKPVTRTTTKAARKAPALSTRRNQEPPAEFIPPKPVAKSKAQPKHPRPSRQKTARTKAALTRGAVTQDRSKEKDSKTRLPQPLPPPAATRSKKRKRETGGRVNNDEAPAIKRTKKVQPQEPTPEDSPSKVSRLTEGNLLALDRSNRPPMADVSPQTYRDRVLPDEASDATSCLTRDSATPSVQKSAQTIPDEKIDYQLRIHRIHKDRKLKLPEGVSSLVESIKAPFVAGEDDGDAVNNGREVAALSDDTCDMGERDAQNIPKNWLGYRGYREKIPEGTMFGQENIYRKEDRRWRPRSVPIVTAHPKDRILQRKLLHAGLPSDPQPDLTYGYDDTAFGDEADRLIEWDAILIGRTQPWLPYWVVEWKASGTGGKLGKALLQVRRDGAAAVSSLYAFYHFMGYTDPPPERTAIFTTCVDSYTIFTHVHWRRVEPVTNLVSYEMSLVKRGFLGDAIEMAHMRGIIWRMLAWARGPRLQHIKDTMAKYPLATAPPPLEPIRGMKKRERETLKAIALLQQNCPGWLPPTAPPNLSRLSQSSFTDENASQNSFRQQPSDSDGADTVRAGSKRARSESVDPPEPNFTKPAIPSKKRQTRKPAS